MEISTKKRGRIKEKSNFWRSPGRFRCLERHCPSKKKIRIQAPYICKKLIRRAHMPLEDNLTLGKNKKIL